MKHLLTYWSTMTLSIVLLFSMMSCSDLSKDEQAVWELEESYWRYAKNNDTVSYLNLWDDKFIGWPGLGEPPKGKENIVDWIAPLHKNLDNEFDYELTRKVVRPFGDVVVVQYYVRRFMRSRANMNEIKEIGTFRIWHTWQRKGKTWQIITGMSSPLPEN